jgi:hypothetical protein
LQEKVLLSFIKNSEEKLLWFLNWHFENLISQTRKVTSPREGIRDGTKYLLARGEILGGERREVKRIVSVILFQTNCFSPYYFQKRENCYNSELT